MAKHVGMILVAVAVVVILLISTVAFTVPSTEWVLVQTFGRTTSVLDGARSEQAGLHFKWPYPIQQAVRFEARTFAFEDAETQFQTSDKKQMLATMFCAWRIADPQKFSRTVENIPAAETGLRNLLRDVKQKVLPKWNMADYINTEPGKMKLGEIEREAYEALKAQAQKDYGVEVLLVGIKSLGLPESVTKDVIEAMKKERQAEASYYRASGEAQAKAIRERARSASEQIASFARTRAEKIRAEGEAAAAKYLQQLGENKQLSMFLRYLESLKTILKDKAVIVLDPKVLPPLGWFESGPTDISAPPSMPEAPGPSAQDKSDKAERK